MKPLYYLLIISIFNSCATLKSDKLVDGQIKLTNENLNLLNGKYSRISTSETESETGDLFWNLYTKGYNVGEKKLCNVELKVIDEKKIEVSLMKNDSLIKSKILKGKIKNGYFEFKKRTFILPTIFLNTFRTTKFRVGILENSNLTTDYSQVSFGTGFVIIPFYEKENEPNFEYGKVN